MLVGTDGTGKLLLIGLSRRNIELLMEDKPIRINDSTHPGLIPKGVSVAIMFGETEDAIAARLREHHDGVTEITDQVQPLPDEIAAQIGPTGQFPQGKSAHDDEGELRAVIAIRNGQIELHFGTPVRWLSLGRTEALHMIGQLQNLVKKLPEE